MSLLLCNLFLKNSSLKKGYVTKTNSIIKTSDILVILLNRALQEKKLNQHIEFSDLLLINNLEIIKNFNLIGICINI